MTINDIINEVKKMNVKDEVFLMGIISDDLSKKIYANDPERKVWDIVTENSLKPIWDNTEDDVYNQLSKG